jgi:hypothetical protein
MSECIAIPSSSLRQARVKIQIQIIIIRQDNNQQHRHQLIKNITVSVITSS